MFSIILYHFCCHCYTAVGFLPIPLYKLANGLYKIKIVLNRCVPFEKLTEHDSSSVDHFHLFNSESFSLIIFFHTLKILEEIPYLNKPCLQKLLQMG